MNSNPQHDDSEGERMTAGGTLVPPRDRSGKPTDDEEELTEEAEQAEETELATGHSVDDEGRPLPVEPPPAPSTDQD